MPSRKLSAPCPKCRTQNHLRAKFCNECGKHLPPAKIPCDDDGREKVHRDIAHPITSDFRQILQESVLEAFEAERGPEEIDDPVVDDVEEEVEEEEVEEVADSSSDEGRDDDDDDDEEEDAEEDDDNRGNVSEYDAIIADLRGDRERFVRQRDGNQSNQSNRKQSDGKASKSSQPRGRGRGRSDRDNQQRTERKPAAEQSRRTPPPREEKPMVAKKPEPAPMPTSSAFDGNEQDDGDSFAAGLGESSPRENASSFAPVPRKEEPKPEPIEPVNDPVDARDDSDENNDTGFGAGIL